MNTRLGINQKNVLLFLAILTNFAIPFVKYIPVIYYINTLTKIASAVLLGLLCIANRKIALTTTQVLVFFIGLITLFVSGNDLWGGIQYLLTIVCIVAVMMYAHNHLKDSIRIFMVVGEIIVYVNFATLLLFPDGMFENEFTFFLGIDNSHIRWLLPIQVMACIYGYVFQKKNRVVLLSLAVFVTVVIRFSATMIIAFAAFDAILLFPIVGKYLTGLVSAIGYIVSFVLFVVLNDVEFLRPVIVDIFHKDLTFTGRIYTWTDTIAAIKERPLFGYGIVPMDQYMKLIGDVYTHNMLLQILFTGGIVLLAFFIALGMVLYRKSLRSSVEMRNIINALFAALFLSGITEYHIYAPMFMVFMLLGETDAIVKLRCRTKA